MTLLSRYSRRARGYCSDYEDEDELKLNSAQHARSAASRLDDVIDRSAQEQAREEFRRPGYRGAAHWTRSPKAKRALLSGVRRSFPLRNL